ASLGPGTPAGWCAAGDLRRHPAAAIPACRAAGRGRGAHHARPPRAPFHRAADHRLGPPGPGRYLACTSTASAVMAASPLAQLSTDFESDAGRSALEV